MNATPTAALGQRSVTRSPPRPHHRELEAARYRRMVQGTRDAGWNLMSDAAVAYTRERVPVVRRAGGAVEEVRLWCNLLSSQPLAFSIVGELRAHPAAALAVLSRMSGQELVDFDILGAGDRVLDGLQAEWAPDSAVDRSAADIAATVRTAGGRRLLITVEVKYTEDFSDGPLREDGQYDRALAAVGLTRKDAEGLHQIHATQVLRSVLLTAGVRATGGCDDVLVVVLTRDDDERARAVTAAVAAAVPSVPVQWWSLVDCLTRRPRVRSWPPGRRTWPGGTSADGRGPGGRPDALPRLRRAWRAEIFRAARLVAS